MVVVRLVADVVAARLQAGGFTGRAIRVRGEILISGILHLCGGAGDLSVAGAVCAGCGGTQPGGKIEVIPLGDAPGNCFGNCGSIRPCEAGRRLDRGGIIARVGG